MNPSLASSPELMNSRAELYERTLASRQSLSYSQFYEQTSFRQTPRAKDSLQGHLLAPSTVAVLERPSSTMTPFTSDFVLVRLRIIEEEVSAETFSKQLGSRKSIQKIQDVKTYSKGMTEGEDQ